MNLINGDCLIELEKIPDSSVDFVYLDLPYGQTACKWDVKLDLEKLWKQLKRVAKNDRTPFFFSCTTKFGYELIGANPKWFRWDLVWEKNRAAGFLNAYKLPMRKHEMIYCFAKKTPEYDVSSHSEYVEETRPDRIQDDLYGKIPNVDRKRHKDPLPTSVLPPTDDHELIYCFAKKSPEYDVSSHMEFTTQENKANRTNVYGKQKRPRTYLLFC
jgi:site-specific DNA-methyltransferase (adenine-specific)